MAGTITHVGGSWVEGSPAEIGSAVDLRVCEPVALQIAKGYGAQGVLEYYSALISQLLGNVAILFDGTTAEVIATTAAKNARAIAAAKAH